MPFIIIDMVVASVSRIHEFVAFICVSDVKFSPLCPCIWLMLWLEDLSSNYNSFCIWSSLKRCFSVSSSLFLEFCVLSPFMIWLQFLSMFVENSSVPWRIFMLKITIINCMIHLMTIGILFSLIVEPFYTSSLISPCQLFPFPVCFQEFWSCSLHICDCLSTILNKILVFIGILVLVSCLEW